MSLREGHIISMTIIRITTKYRSTTSLRKQEAHRPPLPAGAINAALHLTASQSRLEERTRPGDVLWRSWGHEIISPQVQLAEQTTDLLLAQEHVGIAYVLIFCICYQEIVWRHWLISFFLFLCRSWSKIQFFKTSHKKKEFKKGSP